MVQRNKQFIELLIDHAYSSGMEYMEMRNLLQQKLQRALTPNEKDVLRDRLLKDTSTVQDGDEVAVQISEDSICRQVVDAIRCTSWKHIRTSDGVSLSQGLQIHDKVKRIRVTVRVHVPPRFLFDLLLDVDKMGEVDTMLESAKVLQDWSSGSKIHQLRWLKFKAVWPTNARDFVVITQGHSNSRGYIVGTKSTSHYRGVDIPKHANCVRGDVKLGGYLIRPAANNGNESELILFSHIDLGGHVPAALVNWLGVAAPIKLVASIKKRAEQWHSASQIRVTV